MPPPRLPLIGMGFWEPAEAVLSSWLGTPFQVGNVIGSIGMILISYVMMRSQILSKFIASMGILAGALGLAMYLPGVGVFISILSVVGMQIWYVMIALTLLRFCKGRNNQRIEGKSHKT